MHVRLPPLEVLFESGLVSEQVPEVARHVAGVFKVRAVDGGVRREVERRVEGAGQDQRDRIL